MQDNRLASYRIYIDSRPAGKMNPNTEKLYNTLIALDAAYCMGKVNGSIELHYSQGVLAKIHRKEVI